MLIVDALRRAGTAQEVCYLLTSYVESLQFYDLPHHLPAQVTALPVRGLDDIEARLDALRGVCHVSPECRSGGTDYAMLEEAIHLFGVAQHHLQALDAPSAARYAFDRRASARPGDTLSQ